MELKVCVPAHVLSNLQRNVAVHHAQAQGTYVCTGMRYETCLIVDVEPSSQTGIIGRPSSGRTFPSLKTILSSAGQTLNNYIVVVSGESMNEPSVCTLHPPEKDVMLW